MKTIYHSITRSYVLSLGSMLLATGLLTLIATSAHATGYYNCATPTGCSKVDGRYSRSDYNKTQYPIVLVHGFFGWNRLIGGLDYFNGVPQTLMKNGAEVFATKTASVNSSEVRGEQLFNQVNYITAVYGVNKVNLIGHSQGGLDSRYVATVAPQKVASVTTVSSPHKGTKTSDYVLNNIVESNSIAGQVTTEVLLASVKAVGLSEDVLSGVPLGQLHDQNGLNFVKTTNTNSISEFNAKYPAPLPATYCGYPPKNNVVNGVGYYSWAGTSQLTNALDASDYTLLLTALTHDGLPNDGLVDYCSTRIGHVIRDDYRMNHLDTINQLLGLVSWRETNPLTVYRTQVNRLKKQGY